MAKVFLYLADIDASEQQMGGERMAEGVNRGMLVDARPANGGLQCPLQSGI
jgi:hypothetical protein